MKKILFAVLLFLLSAPFAMAQQNEEKLAGRPRSGSDEKLVGLRTTDEALISMDSTVSRLNQLDRRLSDMQRELRDQRDRIRYLERDLNDVKRETYASSQDF